MLTIQEVVDRVKIEVNPGYKEIWGSPFSGEDCELCEKQKGKHYQGMWSILGEEVYFCEDCKAKLEYALCEHEWTG